MRGLAVVVDDDGNYIIKKELVLCKDCKHRPVEFGSSAEGPLKDNAKDDWDRDYTCPFLCDDCYYSRIPVDDFYCASGEKK